MMIWLARLWAVALFWLRTNLNLQVTINPIHLTPAERELLEARAQQLREIGRYVNGVRIPAPLPAVRLCGEVHKQTGAACEKPVGHLQNHCGPYQHGVAQWPIDQVDPMEVGVDWAEGVDISVYSCRACGYETSLVEELLKHMKAHGATRLAVIPLNRPPSYRFGDRR